MQARKIVTRLGSRQLSASSEHFKVVVLGAGTGGAAVAQRLQATCFPDGGQVAIVDPAKTHYYQPGFTKVGAGLMPMSEVQCDSQELTKNLRRFTAGAAEIDADKNTVTLSNGDKLQYDALVVALGCETDFDAVPGMKDAVFDVSQPVISNYSPKSVTQTLPQLQKFRGGTATFMFAPHKCPGAPQKVMYLADDIFRQNGVRDKSEVHWYSTIPRIFGIPKYADALEKVVEQREIQTHFEHSLVEIHGDNQRATWKDNKTGETHEQHYDLLHVVPGLAAPKLIRDSNLAAESGFLSIDKETMQSTTHANVFGIGDCVDIPSTKTAAAAAAQSPVVTQNVAAFLSGKELPRRYDGYTSCPLFVGDDKLILAEFSGFTAQPMESFAFDQSQPTHLSFFLNTKIMPEIYWKLMVERGVWGGPGEALGPMPLSPRELGHLGLTKLALKALGIQPQ